MLKTCLLPKPLAFYGLNVDAMYFYTNTLAKKVYHFSPSDLNNIKEIHNNLHEIRNSDNIYLAFQYDAKLRDGFLKSNNIDVVYENKSNNFILGRIKE